MLKKCVLFLLVFICVSKNISAQQPIVGTTDIASVHVKDFSYSRSIDTLYVKLTLNLKDNIVGVGEALHIVPVYRADNHEFRFPEILVNSKRQQRYYRRDRALLSHEEYWKGKPYIEIVPKKNTPIEVEYQQSVILPKELSASLGGQLLVEKFLEDCCDWRYVGTELLSGNKPNAVLRPIVSKEPKSLPPFIAGETNVVFLRPEHEERKERKENLTLKINFIVNRHDILPTYKSNAIELRKADDLLKPLSSQRETYTLTSAMIKGYASPEDTYSHNMQLSQRRADAFQRYLINRYGLYGLTSFPSQGMGEDWEGLRRLVDVSDMPDRDKVLAIIDFVDLNMGREKQLMDLKGGVPYKWMLANLFPQLRRMEMQVSYTVRPFKEMETEKVFETRPQDLSQEEIYLLARKRNAHLSTDEARSRYGKEYDVAARLFPNDATALVNASSAALIRGEASIAWDYLEKIQRLPEAANNIGVYYMLREDYQRAYQYFEQALMVERTAEVAERNINILNQRWLKK